MRIVSTGWWYATPVLLPVPLVFLISPAVSVVLLGVGVGILGFFRDPRRTPPPTGVLAPADGRVSVLRAEDERIRIGIFMNLIDVHVNRSPVSGEIVEIEHRPGAHRPAFSKASERNERLRMVLEREEGAYTVELIAGAFARRITPYPERGDAVERAERIGHIAFGSRVDVLLPPGFDREAVTVERGARVRAGESVIALEDNVLSDR